MLSWALGLKMNGAGALSLRSLGVRPPGVRVRPRGEMLGHSIPFQRQGQTLEHQVL